MAPERESPHAPRLRIERIEVRADRVLCDVRVPDPRHRATDAALFRRATQAFPSLPDHTCVNGGGSCFGDVGAKTSLPHLMEHIAIDIMAAQAQDDRTFLGATEWIDRKAGLARIALSYADDLACLSALKQAAAFLNGA